MALRRTTRWILLCMLIVVVFYWQSSPSPPSKPRSRLKIIPSSYDWSQWTPVHAISSITPLPSDKPHKLPAIQFKPTRPSRFEISVQAERREFVKKVLRKSWKNYREYAWMRDELTPVYPGGRDTFGGWAATAVDALDTLWIMGMKPEFYEAVNAVIELDWAKTAGTSCNMFETTIRHLGGLLSAYDLSKEQVLLDKAVELGDMLYAAFDTPNHMPPFWLDYEKAKKGQLLADDHQPAASATSLTLEFTRLAQLTGVDKYYDAVARITDRLYQDQNKTKVPGMWPTYFDLRNNGGLTWNNEFTLGALSDSMYEYVMKMQLLLAGTEPKYEQMYRTASQTIAKHLLFRPMTPDNLDILFTGTGRANKNVTLEPDGQHLACFAGGMFALGGKVYNIPEDVEIGARLTRGCIWAYDSFPSGIMPEIFSLASCDTLDGCPWDEEKWKGAAMKDSTYGYPPKGFLSTHDPKYILRPEALESVFIMYRITGDNEYREAAWRMFQNIVKATETDYGNSAISDVRTTDTSRVDSQESFWLAETLKYAFLTFSPAEVISLDEYVFNTEAHPLRIPRR